MIGLFSKRFRKWLLRMALAVQKGSGAIVSRLSSVEKTKTKEDEKKIPPGTIKTARFQGPPDHWIHLVKRHAPELLQPAAPHVVAPSASQLFKEHSDTGGVGADTKQSFRSDEAYENACGFSDKVSPLKSPRFFEKYDALSTVGVKKTDSDFSRFSKAGLKYPTGFPPGSQSPPPEPSQSAFNKGVRFSDAPPNKEKKDGLQLLKFENINESTNFRKTAATQRKSEAPVARISFATFSLSDTGQVENPGSGRADGKNARPDIKKNFLSPIRNVRYWIQEHLQGENPQIHFPSDTERFAFRAVKNQTAYGKNSRQTGLFKPSGVLETATVQLMLSQIKKKINESISTEQEPVKDIGHQFYRNGKSKTIEDMRTRSPELQWPRLPEEDGFENIPDASCPDTWPSLPEEEPLSRKLVLQLKQKRLLKPDLRQIERLRRLDEEQKGRVWNALHS